MAGVSQIDSEDVGTGRDRMARVKIVVGEMNVDDGDVSSDNPLPVSSTPNAPLSTSIFSGTATGTAAAAVADIAGTTGITANKVFQGVVAISATATQSSTVQAAGTLVVTITWVPGSGGTTTQRVATVNINLAANAPLNLTATETNSTITIPIQLYVGTTTGKFQVEVLVTGTISTLAWSVFVNGSVS